MQHCQCQEAQKWHTYATFVLSRTNDLFRVPRTVLPKSQKSCNNYHWMCFHKHLETLGILSTWPPDRDAKGLTFQTDKTRYFIWPLDDEIRANLRNQIEFGKGCMAIATSVPETGPQYIKAWKDTDKDCEPLLGGQKEDGYVRKWVKRGFLRWLMQRSGEALKLTKNRQLVNIVSVFQTSTRCWYP